MKLDFIWAPYVSNLTDLAMGFEVKKIPSDLINAEVGIISFTLVTQLLLAGNAKAYILDVEYR
ncbi:hypothetical protein H5410_003884 [Solanum commersonii]|uniref:Uncharacterized protein n=1 Tax=Solanum commersonii TaxID=4109 RepID=A0A9J6B6X2_SOLCO|nr:hypothetical protein H5410_003884 [Solanum commersonii]